MTAGLDPALVVEGPLVGSWPSVHALCGPRPTVTLTVTDHAGHRWSTTGPADPAPGTRIGRAETALWARLRGPDGAVFALSGPSPVEVTATALDSDSSGIAGFAGRVATTRNELTCDEVEGGGFDGVLVAPLAPGPGIVLLGGSEGGVGGSLPTALALADRGWWCLMVGYVGTAGTPSTLSEVAIEPILGGLEWLARHTGVVGSHVSLWGVSKGAEAAIVASTLSRVVDRVVAVSGSPVVFEGLDPTRRSSSWTVDDAPMPFTKMARLRAWVVFARRSRPATLRPIYRRGPRSVRSGAPSSAHLDRLRVPVLMLSGADDRFWPAAEMADRAQRRCASIEARTIIGGGHLLTVPGIPPVLAVGRQPTLRAGGSPDLLPHAIDEAWEATVSFLDARHRSVAASSR